MKKTSNDNDNKAKVCFSYIRYSSKGQGKDFGGSSVERQLEIAPRVAAEKGWTLDEALNIQSLGLSAYHGSNKKTIEGIIEAVKCGKILPGTVCIIEALDRLTRLKLDDAYQLLRSLLKAGIEIYTANSGRHLTENDLNNPMSVMMSVVELDSAFQYSDKLSDRVAKAWKVKRQNGKAGQINKNGNRTKVCPAWIDAKTWEVIPDKANVVRKMFELYLAGNGISKIASILNAAKPSIPTFNGGKWWNTAYIGQTLKNHNVIGELQPKRVEGNKRTPIGEIIKGYYPAIISEEMFYQVQEKYTTAYKGRIRHTHKTPNIFAGVARCVCGERMNRINGTTQSYLCCSAVTNKANTCKQPMLRYKPIEHSFVELLSVKPELFVIKTESTINEVETISSKIFSISTKIDNITNAIIDGGANSALVAKQSELIKDKEQLELELKIAKSKQSTPNTSKEDMKRVTDNIVNFETDVELRNIVRDFCINNFKSMIFTNKKREYVITFNNGKSLKFNLDKDFNAFLVTGDGFAHYVKDGVATDFWKDGKQPLEEYITTT